MDAQISLLNVYSKFKANQHLETLYEEKMKELGDREHLLIGKETDLFNKEAQFKQNLERKEAENSNLRLKNMEMETSNNILRNKIENLNQLVPDAEDFRMLKIVFSKLMSKD